MKNIDYFVVSAIAVALCLPSSAFAQTVVYKGYDANPGPGESLATNPNATAASNSFRSQLTGVSTEGFEGFATGTSAPLNLSFTGTAGTLSAVLSGSGSVESATRASPTGTGQYATAGSKYFQIDGTDFTVTFGSPIAAFGFFGADLEAASGINITLNYQAGGSQAYNLATLFGYTTSDYRPGTEFLPSGSVHFLGFIDKANPFKSIVFSGAGAGGDILAFDQMTIGESRQVTGSVPEPATWAMMIGGFGAIGGSFRYRRRTAKISFV